MKTLYKGLNDLELEAFAAELGTYVNHDWTIVHQGYVVQSFWWAPWRNPRTLWFALLTKTTKNGEPVKAEG